jgi:type I restriction enzyme M protein
VGTCREVLRPGDGDLGAAVSAAFRALEARFSELSGLFTRVDFADRSRFSEASLLRALVSDADVPGEASRVADAPSERSLYRPSVELTRLMVDLLDVRAGMSVYDPACGPADLLIAAEDRLSEVERARGRHRVVGAERDLLNWVRLKMALRRRGRDGLTIELGDPLTELVGDPPTGVRSSVRPRPPQFDRVLCNPPFSRPRWDTGAWGTLHGIELARYGRPPRRRADYAFILHMLASLKEHGSALVLLPYGVLYRDDEKEIRERLVREGVIAAIVRLGPNLCAETRTPVVLLVLQRDRPEAQRRSLLFIDAEAHRRGPGLSSELNTRIVEVVRGFRSEHGFSQIWTCDDLQRRNFNLSIDARDAPNVDRVEPCRPSRPRRPSADSAGDVRDAQRALEAAREAKKSRAFALLSRGLCGVSRRVSELGEYPQGWEICRLGTVCSFLGGRTIPRDPNGSEALYLGQDAITIDGVVEFSTAERVHAAPRLVENRRVVDGDLLFVRVHSSPDGCGRVGLVRSAPGRSVCKDGILRIRSKLGEVDPVLILHWLQHPPVRACMRVQSRTGSRASINQRVLGELPCPRIPNCQHAVRHSEPRVYRAGREAEARG